MSMMTSLAFAALGVGQVPVGSVAGPPPPTCVASQLSLSVDGMDGQFNGMQHSGTELSIRNTGADCTLPALPHIDMLDARGHVLPARRAGPVGMHPGPVMIPVRLAGGHRAATDLTWISGPVYPQNRQLRIAYLRVTIGGRTRRTKLVDIIDTQPGRPATFAQPPLRAMEGMAGG